jgi:aminoglycoside 6'-N-acetyltransferase
MGEVALPRRTERLVLRSPRHGDEPGMLAYRSRADVSRFLLRDPLHEDDVEAMVVKRAQQQRIAEDDDWLSLVLELDGRVVGDISLHCPTLEHGQAEIGWVLHPEVGGRGLATEAARAVLDMAFDDIGLHRVYAQLDPRNTASKNLCLRLGMRQEAHLREQCWFKGEWGDVLVFAILSDEWTTVRQAGT